MIAIIDYKAGNLTSVKLALDALNVPSKITNDIELIKSAERVIFPGVGAAGAAMSHIAEFGLKDALIDFVKSGKPFLGICLGTQILLNSSEEDNNTTCLGIIPGEVKRFQPTNKYDKIPHMGWNRCKIVKQHPVFEGIEDLTEFYFVHSYYCHLEDEADTVMKTDYADISFTSVLGRDNLIATQFHPERSGRIGQKLLENFSKWGGQC